jgi:hypothetical protein
MASEASESLEDSFSEAESEESLAKDETTSGVLAPYWSSGMEDLSLV